MRHIEFNEIVQAVRAQRNEIMVKKQQTDEHIADKTDSAQSHHNITPLDVRKLVEDTLLDARTQAHVNEVSVKNVIRANAIADAFTNRQTKQANNTYIPRELIFDHKAQDTQLSNQINLNSEVDVPREQSVKDELGNAEPDTNNIEEGDTGTNVTTRVSKPTNTLAKTVTATEQSQLQAIVEEQQAKISTLEATLLSISKPMTQKDVATNADVEREYVSDHEDITKDLDDNTDTMTESLSKTNVSDVSHKDCTKLSFNDLLLAHAQVTEEANTRHSSSEDSSKFQVNAVALMRLVHLIEPILSLLCETFTFERCHIKVSLTTFTQRLNQCFLYIEQQCANNLELKRAYADIERPLYFFIDYFVHENKLSFYREFRGLGRRINEFSGDEKFFELLDISLKENYANDKNYVFFLFMALGFQGSHKGDAIKLRYYMHALGTRLETKLKLRPHMCLNLEQLTRDYDEEGHKTRKLLRNSLLLKRWMWVSIVLFGIAFGINNVIYYYTTRDFQTTLDHTITEMFNYVKRKGGSEFMLGDAINTQRDSSLMTDAMERFQADSSDFIGNLIKSQQDEEKIQPPIPDRHQRPTPEASSSEQVTPPSDNSSVVNPAEVESHTNISPTASISNLIIIRSNSLISTEEISPYGKMPLQTRLG